MNMVIIIVRMSLGLLIAMAWRSMLMIIVTKVYGGGEGVCVKKDDYL